LKGLPPLALPIVAASAVINLAQATLGLQASTTTRGETCGIDFYIFGRPAPVRGGRCQWWSGL